MAGGVNKVILVGHLGGDPEVKYTPSGTCVCEFRIATTESWKDKNGAKQERTEWHRIVVWSKLAEICGKYLEKGRQVFIEGRIQTRSYEDREGQKRYITEIVANDVQFLGSGGGRDGRRGGDDDGPPPPDGDAGNGGGYGGGRGGGPDDDIPF